MTQPLKKNAARFIEELRSLDPEVYEVMQRAQVTTRSENTRGEPVMSQETIVLRQGRPVLDIKGGATVLDIVEIESQVWRQRLAASVDLLKSHVPRLDVSN